MKDHLPPGSNWKRLKVLVNPAGPHQVASLAGSRKDSKIASGVAGINLDVLKVLTFFLLFDDARLFEHIRANHWFRLKPARQGGYYAKPISVFTMLIPDGDSR